MQVAPFASVPDFLRRVPSYDTQTFRQVLARSELKLDAIKDSNLRATVASADRESKDLFLLSGVLARPLRAHLIEQHPEVADLASAVRPRRLARKTT